MLFFGGGLQSPRRRSREKSILLTILLVVGIYFVFFANGSGRSVPVVSDEEVLRKYHASHPESKSPSYHHQQTDPDPIAQMDMVVASMKKDNTSWLYEHFPEWHKSIYVVDDSSADLTVAHNKGRESMVYLTYIIDNYDRLPEVMLFIHSLRFQWHNDDPYYDGVPMLRNFQVPYLKKQGYVNLRCTWALGCPTEIRPYTDTHRDNVHAGEYFKNGFMELFPGVEVPQEVGVSCCAQFGVTRATIRERPRSDYERFRKWLAATDLKDELSGRIMEYSWHMIFGKEAVHCPTAQDCYCNVFGLCDLTCPDTGNCNDRYALPPFSSLPKGWPYIGWKGQEQDPTKGRPET